MIAFVPGAAYGDEPIRNWWREARHDPNWGKPCPIKLEKTKNGYTREVRCKNGVGASWRGDWTDEFQDGSCRVKLQATRDVFREEVRCNAR